MMNPAEFANIAGAEHELWWYRGMRRILFRVLEPFLGTRQVRRVLEAGCGTGFFARTLEQERGWDVYPSDIAWEGLSYGRDLGLSRLSQADLAALPFAEGAFDMVTAIDVLAHFPPGEENRPIGELSRVLSPGGLLVLRASALDILRSHHSEFVNEQQRFTRSRLMRAISAAGIRVLRCTYANTILLPAAFAKFRLWEPLSRRAPESGVKPVAGWLDRLLYGCLCAESGWLARGLNLPVGQSLILVGEKIA
jgi:SAM-dependent methyltransferase